jgi:hypothetical protein
MTCHFVLHEQLWKHALKWAAIHVYKCPTSGREFVKTCVEPKLAFFLGLDDFDLISWCHHMNRIQTWANLKKPPFPSPLYLFPYFTNFSMYTELVKAENHSLQLRPSVQTTTYIIGKQRTVQQLTLIMEGILLWIFNQRRIFLPNVVHTHLKFLYSHVFIYKQLKH